jgi:NADH-quinone oxidoreductase subunit A
MQRASRLASLAKCAQSAPPRIPASPAACYARNFHSAMPVEYIPIFVFAVIVAAVPAAAFAWARRAGRTALSDAASENAAAEPLALEETERRQNTSQIFLVGALFVLCDALIIFMLPWAARIGELGAFGLVAIAGFLAVVACGYAWLYRNRALERL